MSTSNLPIDTSDPETRVILKLLRLQVLTPLSVLINIATSLICGLVVKPNISDLSRAFPTAVSPYPIMVGLAWLVVFVLQILYCVLLVTARRSETRRILVNGVGLRLVFANWIMTAWAIIFSLKIWLVSTILLSVLLALLIWINITLIAFKTSYTHPFDFLAIHAPMRLFLIIVFIQALPQSIFIQLDWVYSPDHPERDYNARSWEAFAFILGTNLAGLVWVFLRRDLVWTISGVWIMLAMMFERPKPAPVFAVTIMMSVLYPLVFIMAIAWNRLREADRRGTIVLPEDEQDETEVARARASASHHRQTHPGDEPEGPAQVWA